jgi:DNA anti-recombination protein RmuC
MTMPIKFDTLEYTKRLVEAGIPPDQAETHAHALLAALSESTVAPSELVLVRSDLIARIEMLRTEMTAKIDELRAEMTAKIDELRAEMTAKIDELRAEMTGKIDELRAEMNAKIAEVNAKIEALRAEMNAKFTTVYWMLGVSFALHAVTIGMLWKILDRLP